MEVTNPSHFQLTFSAFQLGRFPSPEMSTGQQTPLRTMVASANSRDTELCLASKANTRQVIQTSCEARAAEASWRGSRPLCCGAPETCLRPDSFKTAQKLHGALACSGAEGFCAGPASWNYTKLYLKDMQAANQQTHGHACERKPLPALHFQSTSMSSAAQAPASEQFNA